MANDFGTHTEYHNQVFRKEIFQNKSIHEVEFYQCEFHKCSFNEATFEKCKFLECKFTDCDLSLIKVPKSKFTSTTFENCQVIGVNWVEAAWSNVSLIGTIEFHKSVINYSTFFGLNLPQIKITDCMAKEVDFSETILTKADCRRTDFEASRFLHTDLTAANFEGAQNYQIDAGNNIVSKTRFSLPEAMSLLYSLDIILEE